MSVGISAVWPRVGTMALEIVDAPDEPERLISLMRGFGLGAVQLGEPLLGKVMAEEGSIAAWSVEL